MQLPRLNFPDYDFKLQRTTDELQRLQIFDIIRKKYVRLTPEEWVRQHLIQFLVNERKFPQSLLSVEKKLLINGLEKRTDLVVYSNSLQPLMLAECKAPEVTINQAVFDQAARYNLKLNVSYFLLSNGLETFTCRIDHLNKRYDFLQEVPYYEELKSLT